MTTFVQAVCYLDNVVTVHSQPSALIFKNYIYCKDKWSATNDIVYKTSFDQVINFGLYQVAGNIGRTPCALCRHRRNLDDYCVLRYTPNGICMVSQARNENGLLAMISGDVIAQVECDKQSITKHWQFDWSRLHLNSTMVIIKLIAALAYVLVSSEGGMASSKSVSRGIYIPSEYDSIVECIDLYWREGYSAGCGIVNVPLFVIGTSSKQILMFENGTTILCLPVDNVPLHSYMFKVSRSVAIISIVLYDSSIVLCKITNINSAGLLQSETLKTINNIQSHSNTVIRRRHQLLAVLQNCNGDEELLYPIYDLKKIMISSHMSPNDGVVHESLSNASKALEIRKLCNESIIDEKVKLLEQKVQLLTQGINVISRQRTSIDDQQSLLTLDCTRTFDQQKRLN